MKLRFPKLAALAFASTALLASHSAFALSGTVATEGSTSMELLIGALGESFTEANPDVKFSYNPTGSGAGINAAEAGRTDIGLSSRGLKGDENKALDATVVALDGIVVIVNKDNKVKDLTLEQIKDIYTGKIKSWKELGGDDNPIVLIGREAGSGTRDGFETVVDAKDQCKYRQELTSTGDVITIVSKNINAVGYASLSAVNDKIHTVKVNGVTATEDTILDGTYKLQRPFLMVTKKGKPESEAVQAFMKYATSKDAHDIIKMAGVVPVSDIKKK